MGISPSSALTVRGFAALYYTKNVQEFWFLESFNSWMWLVCLWSKTSRILERHMKSEHGGNVTWTISEPFSYFIFIISQLTINCLTTCAGTWSRIASARRGCIVQTPSAKCSSYVGGSQNSELLIYLDLCLYFGRVKFPYITSLFIHLIYGSDMVAFNFDVLIKQSWFYPCEDCNKKGIWKYFWATWSYFTWTSAPIF